MAWEETEIVIADATMKCSIKRDNDKMIIEMPFLEVCQLEIISQLMEKNILSMILKILVTETKY